MKLCGLLFAAVFSSGLLQADLISDAKFTDYNAVFPGAPVLATQQELDAINNNGIAVGVAIGTGSPAVNTVGFRFDGTTATSFSLPFGDLFARVNGINDSGVLAGYDTSASRETVGFFGRPGAYSLLRFPGATSTFAYSINNAGVIVGGYIDSNKVEHGFIYNPDGTFQTVDAPGRTSVALFGINNNGEIVGASANGGGPKYIGGDDGFLYANGTFTTLSVHFAGIIVQSSGTPVAINDAGEIALANTILNAGIVDADGTLETIRFANGGGTSPYGGLIGFNNQRQIVGNGAGSSPMNGNGVYYATPIPEPRSVALMLTAATLFFAGSRIRFLKFS